VGAIVTALGGDVNDAAPRARAIARKLLPDFQPAKDRTP
jgi:hypothetical protein